MRIISEYTKLLVDRLKTDFPDISEVFLVACGGSLVDLYSAKYFLAGESRKLRTDLITANEFVHSTPRVLGKRSVVIICSHSGKTPELVEGTRVAQNAGALTITLTNNVSSEIAKHATINIIYDWGEDSLVQDNPMAIALALCLEILHYTEEYAHYKDFHEALIDINDIVSSACQQVGDRVQLFAKTYEKENMFYILSSGASYGHAYGFAICSLMEMQWLNASSIHSGEFFHGPFEVTDKDTNFIVLVNEGRTRPLDIRVLSFLDNYAGKYEVVDARELGMGNLPKTVVDFFNPILFYSVLSEYRQALANIRNHPLETRRYMGKVKY